MIHINQGVPEFTCKDCKQYIQWVHGGVVESADSILCYPCYNKKHPAHDGKIEQLKKACLSTSKRRYRNSLGLPIGGSASLQPCWCQTDGIYCLGQPQCHEARKAVEP